MFWSDAGPDETGVVNRPVSIFWNLTDTQSVGDPVSGLCPSLISTVAVSLTLPGLPHQASRALFGSRPKSRFEIRVIVHWCPPTLLEGLPEGGQERPAGSSKPRSSEAVEQEDRASVRLVSPKQILVRHS